jgi:hypothetical protein
MVKFISSRPSAAREKFGMGHGAWGVGLKESWLSPFCGN